MAGKVARRGWREAARRPVAVREVAERVRAGEEEGGGEARGWGEGGARGWEEGEAKGWGEGEAKGWGEGEAKGWGEGEAWAKAAAAWEGAAIQAKAVGGG
jgi:hypothetical protein